MKTERPNSGQKPQAGFTAQEIKIFRIHAVMTAAIAAGLFVVAPKGLGQVLGIIFALVLLSLPAVVIYFLRRRKTGSG